MAQGKSEKQGGRRAINSYDVTQKCSTL